VKILLANSEPSTPKQTFGDRGSMSAYDP
jgi:hypothetical protein